MLVRRFLDVVVPEVMNYTPAFWFFVIIGGVLLLGATGLIIALRYRQSRIKRQRQQMNK